MSKNATAILLCLAYGILAYYLTMNLIFTGIILALTFFVMFKYLLPNINRVKDYMNRLDELHSFATSFVMQLSSTPAPFEALKYCKPYFKEGVEHIVSIYDDDLEDLLNALDNFFMNQSYRILSEIIRIYVSSGGEISSMCTSILQDITFKKTSGLEMYNTTKRKISELLTMWIFAFISIIYLRVGLSSYYLEMLNSSLAVAVFLVLALFILSLLNAFEGFKKISFEDEV